MRLRVRHTTTYRYERSVNYAIQTLRLSPQPYEGLRVHAWRVTRDGRRDLPSLLDGLGNIVHCHTIRQPHTEYTIVAAGEVETSDTNGIVRGAPEPMPPTFFLRGTALTAADPAIEHFATEAVRGGSTVDRLYALMHAVRDRLDYRTGTTHVETTAAEALARGAGVCQDHAHLFIAAARLMGIPARYVSGYLWTGTTGQQDEASHAWAEAFVPEIGWIGFDPSNRVSPSGGHIRAAVGLDYWAAAPVRGIRQGDALEVLDVAVQVQQAAAEQ
jgi:transglutaminase-like putative cysteine protease